MNHKKKLPATFYIGVILPLILVPRIAPLDLTMLRLYAAIIGTRRLSAENISIINIDHDPLLALSTTSMIGGGTNFALYSGGAAVWKNDRSPTGYCSAIIPENIRKRILDMSTDLVPDARYYLADTTDQPMYTIRFGAAETSIIGDSNKLFSPLPLRLVSLFNYLNTFDYAPATSWLPSKLDVDLHPGFEVSSSQSLRLKELNSILPIELKSDSNEAIRVKLIPAAKTITEKTVIELTIPVPQYQTESCSLISLPKNNRTILIKGRPYRMLIRASDGKHQSWYF